MNVAFLLLKSILLIVFIWLFAACMQFRTSVSGVHKEFLGKAVQPDIVDITVQGHNLRYVVVDKDQTVKPVVIFVHGAPGSSDNYFQYMKNNELVNKFTMVSVDRIGYGYSDFGKSETSIERQAGSLLPILQQYHSHHPTILLGHSYGGPIIAKAALMYPDLVDGLIMLAPAIDPENEKVVKSAWLGHNPPFRWLIPRSWRVASDEKITHVAELKKMCDDWAQIKVPILYIQGEKDSLVPYANMSFAKEMIDSLYLKTISIPEEDHFLPWSQTSLIAASIEEMIAQLTESKLVLSSGG